MGSLTFWLCILKQNRYLLHEGSGPFIQPSAAHFDIAFSCTALLASIRPDLLIGNIEQAERSLNACFIQGFFTLLAYASQFWAYHVQAYLHQCRDPGSDSFIRLITELTTLSSVYKDQISLLRSSDTTISTSNNHVQSTIADIPQLSNHPILQVFLRDVAQFQHLDAQKQHTLPTLKGIVPTNRIKSKLTRSSLSRMAREHRPHYTQQF